MLVFRYECRFEVPYSMASSAYRRDGKDSLSVEPLFSSNLKLSSSIPVRIAVFLGLIALAGLLLAQLFPFFIEAGFFLG